MAEPDCTETEHSWMGVRDDQGALGYLICEKCAATVDPPTVAPGEQLHPLNPE